MRCVVGSSVTVKGIGGFHLACDATSEAAVVRLRERKHREEKPLAVMVRRAPMLRRVLISPRCIGACCCLPNDRSCWPTGVRTTLAASLAPGNRQIGLMLPYSPLHLLLADVQRPLVMTSGNRLRQTHRVHER